MMVEHDITPQEILPAEFGKIEYKEDMHNISLGDEKESVFDESEMSDVQDAIETLADNGFERDETLLFARRMAKLCMYGGLTPSEAKVRALGDVTDTGRPNGELADLLGISDGGFSSVKSSVRRSTTDALRLFVMTHDRPVNVIEDFTLKAESPADYEERYVFVETVDPRKEDEARQTFSNRRPDIEYLPAEPTHGVYKFAYTPSAGNWSSDDPSERRYGGFSGLTTEWFMSSEELVEHYFEGTVFNSSERAEFWRETLIEMGFGNHVSSTPDQRVNPDFTEGFADE